MGMIDPVDQFPLVGSPLDFLLKSAGFPTAAQSQAGQVPHASFFMQRSRPAPVPAPPRATAAPKTRFAPQGIDPTNPMDQQSVGNDGTMVDPRYTAMVAAQYGPQIGAGTALGIPPNWLQGAADSIRAAAGQPSPQLPPFVPRVGQVEQDAHPTRTAIAYGLQQALQGLPGINPRDTQGDQFLQGLLRGAASTFANAGVNADQQRQALNTQNRSAAAQMNLLNASISAQQAKQDAKGTGSLVPLSDTLLQMAHGYGINTEPWEKIAAENDGQIPVKAMANLTYLVGLKRGPANRALTPEQDKQAKDFADGLANGTLNPDLLGTRAATPFGGAVISHLHDDHPDFDLANAKLKFLADQTTIRTQNAAQATRYRQAIDSSNKYTQVLDYLNSLRAATGNPNAIVPVNELNQVLARNGLPTSKNAVSIATALRQYTGALQTEYGFVLSAGYAAQGEDKKTAQQTINDAWGTDQFGAGLDNIRSILQIRQSSIPAGGSYTPGGQINLGNGTTPIPARSSGPQVPAPGVWHSDAPVQGWQKMTLQGKTEYVRPDRVAQVKAAGGR